MSKKVKIRNLEIGGGSSVTVQSMLNVSISDIEKAILQAIRLEQLGCDIIRVSIDSEEDAKLIPRLKEAVSMPIVADIQFGYLNAIYAINNGVDAIRINPCYIGDEEHIQEVVEACRKRNLPIRVGVNSGSVKKEFIDKYSGVNKYSLVESCLEQVALIEKYDYYNIVVSIKSTNVRTNYEANKELSDRCDYPIHLGLTESGSDEDGLIKSSMGIGSLLLEGIGDTIRVSLTEHPAREVVTGRKILQYLDIRSYGIEVISCPTCGRTKVDLINIVSQVKEELKGINKDIKVAIMGCAVNGPGEAREADIGFASGSGEAIMFKKGEIVKKIKEEEIIKVLLEEIEKM